MQADIGVIGLAVMGQNLILNIADHGFHVLAHNRSVGKIDDFLHTAKAYDNIRGAYDLASLVDGLQKPRKILLMVRAGQVVDDYIEQLIPLLEAGDIIIDGGNSHHADSERRTAYLRSKGLHFIGSGVSGGEEGARNGPSIMPGGDERAWSAVKPILQAIAAKTENGEICCDWVGKGGAGHFVKMVHNGIEYGDMQLICEAYDFMKTGLNLSAEHIADTFQRWNEGALSSYLIEISAAICRYHDTQGRPLLDSILDTAGQKGTGKWTVVDALDAGIPLTLIGDAVNARLISAQYEQRQQSAATFGWAPQAITGDTEQWLDDLARCLLAAKIISYAQGFMLMQRFSVAQQWDIDLGKTALLWREGCIIRSVFLRHIHDAYQNDADLYFLGAAPYFREKLNDAQQSWRNVVAAASQAGITMPCIASGLTFMDSFTRQRLPANLLQAQRDYFGAHTYERIDTARGEYFHTDWTGHGGNATSNAYKA